MIISPAADCTSHESDDATHHCLNILHGFPSKQNNYYCYHDYQGANDVIIQYIWILPCYHECCFLYVNIPVTFAAWC